MTRYDYQELRAKAIENPTFENLEALADWLRNYGGNSWNEVLPLVNKTPCRLWQGYFYAIF